MTKKEVHDKIWVKEFYSSGLKNLNGSDVKIVNLRIRKREKKVIADIIQECEGETHRYNNCEYPLDELEAMKVDV